MTDLVLTEQEAQMIISHRLEKAREDNQKQKTIILLRVAHEFYDWMVKNGIGYSFTTFLEEFGYIDPNNKEGEVYKGVVKVIEFAKEVTEGAK